MRKPPNLGVDLFQIDAEASDTVKLGKPGPYRALEIQNSGLMTFDTLKGTKITDFAVKVGPFPHGISKLYSSGLTASGIFGVIFE